MLKLVPSVAGIDDIRMVEVAQATVKAINDLPRLGPDDKPGAEAYTEYTRNLVALSWNVIPSFDALGRRDEIGALGLAQGIAHPGLKLSALWGISAQKVRDTTASPTNAEGAR